MAATTAHAEPTVKAKKSRGASSGIPTRLPLMLERARLAEMLPSGLGIGHLVRLRSQADPGARIMESSVVGGVPLSVKRDRPRRTPTLTILTQAWSAQAG